MHKRGFYRKSECNILKKFRNIIAAVICASMLSGCFGNGGSPADTSTVSSESAAQTTAPVTTETETGSSLSAAALASEDEPDTKKEERPLIAAVPQVNAEYTPFSPADEFTRIADKLTGVTLINRTRAGNPVMTGTNVTAERYGGKTYTYNGIADILKRYDEENDITTYNFSLRRDIRFADGETLDADDLIFTLYLHLDPGYSGSYPLQDSGIIGSINYHYDNYSADNITKERIDEVLASDEIKPLIRDRIIVPKLREQYDAVRSMFDDSSYSIYTSKYPTPVELFAFFYAINLRDETVEKYSAKGKDAITVISEVADMYDGNYRQLASITMGDETVFDDEALSIAVGYIAKENGGTEATESVRAASGIIRNNQYSVTVTVAGDGAAFEKLLGDITILPLHYYGSEPLYSYDNCMFGFIKGKAGDVMQRFADKPLGAGPYRYVGTHSGAAEFEANTYYYKGAPQSTTLRLIEKGTMSASELIADGTADICDDSGSADSSTAVDEANRSLEKIYAAISTEPGYGYIGINAKTICIGDSFSDQSYNLRKALGTAIAAYRDESVRSYFGAFGKTTDYPVIEDVIIDEKTEGYVVPYTHNRNGDPIFASGMNDEERREAAKTACLGFFEAAGYTVADGKVTSAPYNGRTEFNAVVVGGGKGDHPCYTALKKASALLRSIGITLTVTDAADAGTLWEALNNGTNEIWAGAWNTETLTTIYVDSYYGADSTKLKLMIRDAEAASGADKQAQFMKCYDKIHNTYATEIPMYLRTRCTLFSTLRIDSDTYPTDMSDTYGWADEIARIRVK